MRNFAKSLLLAFMGTGLFFSFLMMTVIPIQALLVRLGGNVGKLSVVVNPAAFLRSVGVPLAILAFVILFGLAMYRFRQAERQSLKLRH
jgi:hypothetical protein